MQSQKIIIASRESRLAMWQAAHIQMRLNALYPKIDVSILGLTTQGDRILDRPLAKIGGKGLFVKELELALERGEADIAVHSMKDVPMVLPEGFSLAIVGEREDPRDAFVSKSYKSPDELPSGSIVGTSSLRRESQLRARFSHLKIEPLRGNVETRLRKLDEGQYAAIILAAAGLKRLELGHRITSYISLDDSIPAVGQGALGIEYCSDREDIVSLLEPFADSATTACINAERAMSRRLAGSCEIPLGAYAAFSNGTLSINGFVASPDGNHLIRSTLQGGAKDCENLGVQLADALLSQGAANILHSLNVKI